MIAMQQHHSVLLQTLCLQPVQNSTQVVVEPALKKKKTTGGLLIFNTPLSFYLFVLSLSWQTIGSHSQGKMLREKRPFGSL